MRGHIAVGYCFSLVPLIVYLIHMIDLGISHSIKRLMTADAGQVMYLEPATPLKWFKRLVHSKN